MIKPLLLSCSRPGIIILHDAKQYAFSQSDLVIVLSKSSSRYLLDHWKRGRSGATGKNNSVQTKKFEDVEAIVLATSEEFIFGVRGGASSRWKQLLSHLPRTHSVRNAGLLRPFPCHMVSSGSSHDFRIVARHSGFVTIFRFLTRLADTWFHNINAVKGWGLLEFDILG